MKRRNTLNLMKCVALSALTSNTYSLVSSDVCVTPLSAAALSPLEEEEEVPHTIKLHNFTPSN